MRIYRIIVFSVIITFVAVGYVHQRIEIVKSGYNLQKNRKYLSYLVDQNSKLMYNLSKLESPKNLLASLNDQEIEFTNRGVRQLNIYEIGRPEVIDSGMGEGIITRFMDLFTLSAEARTRRFVEN
ncbi:MAG: hypothetical protein ABH883_01400 [Candidatus Omnitrophota bacterium]